MKKNTKGITLIALIITIIILLILLSVTVVQIISDNGIFTKTIQAKKETEKADELERIKLSIIESQIAKNNISYDDLVSIISANLGISKEESEKCITTVDEDTDYIIWKVTTEKQSIFIDSNANALNEIDRGTKLEENNGSIGDFIKYSYPYKDIEGYNYDYNNGWRLLNYKLNDKLSNTYTIEIISTGVPALLGMNLNGNVENWWGTEKEAINIYNDSATKNRAAYGLEYNFAKIKLINNKDERINNRTGNIFIQNNSENSKYRVTNIRNISEKDIGNLIYNNYIKEPATGIFILSNLKELIGYNYDLTGYYWLASPYPHTNTLWWIKYSGLTNGASSTALGVRPIIKLEGVKLEKSQNDSGIEIWNIK